MDPTRTGTRVLLVAKRDFCTTLIANFGRADAREKTRSVWLSFRRSVYVSLDNLQHQLALAGAHEPIFDDDAATAIFDLSFGIPRKIGLVATQALTYAMFSELRTIDADLVLKCKASG